MGGRAEKRNGNREEGGTGERKKKTVEIGDGKGQEKGKEMEKEKV